MKSRFTKTAIMLTVILPLIMFLVGCGAKKGIDASASDGFVPNYEAYNTYAFFGVDSRASGDGDWKTDHSTGTEGAPSSDVIMLVKFDENGEDVKVTSVYRDTMLDVSGDGSDFEKCNTAYREGGPYGAIDMLERNLDIRISGYVSANFMAVADAIDALGGVEVDIEDEETTEYHKSSGDNVVDIMNRYITEMNEIYGKDIPLIREPGRQTLSGLQAVAYSRVRYTEGGDMRRSVRQRDILSLLVGKLKETDARTQRSVLKEMYPTIDTDLTENELTDMFDKLTGFDLGDMEGFPYYKAAYTSDKQKGYMFVPCDLAQNVKTLHERMYGETEYQPNDTVTEYSRLIEEESGLHSEDAEKELDDKY